MALLTRYVSVAIERGLIDEWHVWDFARNDEDRAWLSAKFPQVRMTPGSHTPYFDANMILCSSNKKFKFSVSASNDVHIGLRPTEPGADAIEIVLGGWSNQSSIIRSMPGSELDLSEGERTQRRVLAYEVTPQVLGEYEFTDFSVELTKSSVSVLRGDKVVIRADQLALASHYSVGYRTGYGANAEWRFVHWEDRGAYLFLSTYSGRPVPQRDFETNEIPFYHRFYAHYGRIPSAYRDDIFLKCDDDIVFIDLDRLAAFIEFRKTERDYFLVSANVINNGVCAYFQQQTGQIPETLMNFELPYEGHCGSLWESAERAGALHEFFTTNCETNILPRAEPWLQIWNKRFSINFVSWLGEDFAHIPEIMIDDEAYLSYHARWHSGKKNVIWGGLFVSHLSFYSQEAGLDLAHTLDSYKRLADRILPLEG